MSGSSHLSVYMYFVQSRNFREPEMGHMTQDPKSLVHEPYFEFSAWFKP